MVLNEDDFRKIVLMTIREVEIDKIPRTLVKKSCTTIINKTNTNIDTQEVCDDVLACLEYYNDFVEQKKIQLPIITEDYFNFLVIILNAVIGEVLNERERS